MLKSDETTGGRPVTSSPLDELTRSSTLAADGTIRSEISQMRLRLVNGVTDIDLYSKLELAAQPLEADIDKLLSS